jgi:hypothetical protein
MKKLKKSTKIAIFAIPIIVVIVLVFVFLGTSKSTGGGLTNLFVPPPAKLSQAEADAFIEDNWKNNFPNGYGIASDFNPDLVRYMKDASQGIEYFAADGSTNLMKIDAWKQEGLKPGVALVFENANNLMNGRVSSGVVIFSFTWAGFMNYTIGIDLQNFNKETASNYLDIIYV